MLFFGSFHETLQSFEFACDKPSMSPFELGTGRSYSLRQSSYTVPGTAKVSSRLVIHEGYQYQFVATVIYF